MPRPTRRASISLSRSRSGLPPDPTRDDIANSLLLQTFQQRGVEALIDLGGADRRFDSALEARSWMPCPRT